MNEEEKESIEEFRKQLRLAINIDDVTTTIRNDNAQTILNLIEKLQKENEKYKRLAKINLKNAKEFKDNMCEHRCLLKSGNEELGARLDERKNVRTS